ncbi:MAG: Fibronectin type domain [Myxococcales bacterium]|nr:Fibronectin type domain [Myxococcales bacterium]
MTHESDSKRFSGGALVVFVFVFLASALHGCARAGGQRPDGATADAGDGSRPSGGDGPRPSADTADVADVVNDDAPRPSDGADERPSAAATGPGVLMRGNDLKRTGANLFETSLEPATVTAAGFGKQACFAVDGEIYGQILYLPAFDFGAKGRHDAVVVATMKNRIYVLDAHDPSAVLWSKTYGTPVGPASTLSSEGTFSGCNPYNDISRWVGILSTPTVDPTTGTLYFVARTNESGRQVQKLYAESLVDGADRPGSPVTIDATIAGTGDRTSPLTDVVAGGRFPFVSKRQNQRAALTLTGGIVYIAWSAFCDFPPYHGWVIGYDARTLQQAVVFNTTPNGNAGGIWMSGSGPAVDDDGTLYLATGNGTADLAGGANHGESFLKLRRQGATLEVVDWFVPYEYEFLEAEDRDLGSAGVMLVPGTNLLLGGGKDAKLYVADTTNLGKYTAPTRAYQPLSALGPQILPEGSDHVVQTLAVASMSVPPRAHNHSTPVYWKSDAGTFVYTFAEEDTLQQWRLVDGTFELFESSQVRAPYDPNARHYTMPGGTMSLSADGDKSASGIVWVTLPISLDANNAVVPGQLYAFAAADVSRTLWSSETNASRDAVGNYAKFNPVTVYGGKVYVPTFRSPEATNQFCVYGRL